MTDLRHIPIMLRVIANMSREIKMQKNFQWSNAEISLLQRQGSSSRIWLFGLIFLLFSTICLFIGGFAYLWRTTPATEEALAKTQTAPTQVFSADGVLLDLIGHRARKPVTLEEVSPHIVHALIATEDRRFYSHFGLDFQRILAATWRTAQGTTQGGSTISQQLARNIFPRRIGKERSLWRKLREAVMAVKLENAFTKQEILTMYLNHVDFLYNVTGVEMAARTYFGKPAARVTAAEAALLVAMLNGPAQFDPLRAPDRATQRRNLVLSLMQRDGALSAEEAANAQGQDLGVELMRMDITPPVAPHFTYLVGQHLKQWSEENGYDLQREGLRVYTTIDMRLQRVAESAVARQTALLQSVADYEWSSPALRSGPPPKNAQFTPFAYFWQREPELLASIVRTTPRYQEATARGIQDAAALRDALQDRSALQELMAAKTRLETGFLALDPNSGAVRAYVGSRDFVRDRFDHVVQAQRQPGSTFKPFVYGVALQNGLSPDSYFLDLPTDIPLGDGRIWTPRDAGTSSGQWMTMRTGLARSRNTITAQVMQKISSDQVISYARAMGVQKAFLESVPSLALGTSPVSLMEMTHAYATLAALGERRDPQIIERIIDRRGQEVARFTGTPRQVIAQEQAIQLIDMLRDAVDKGTGRLLRSRFGIRADVAGKTGTTQNNADGWFFAMRPDLVVGTWVGFNDQRVTMRSSQWGRGGNNALLVVGDFLQTAGIKNLIDMSLRFPSPPPSIPPPPPPLPDEENILEGQRIMETENLDSVISIVSSTENNRTRPVRINTFPVQGGEHTKIVTLKQDENQIGLVSKLNNKETINEDTDEK